MFGGHTSDAFEVAVEGGWFRESEHVGGFLKCLCGASLNEALGLCRHVLLYPFRWRDVGDSADNFAEMFGREVQKVCVIFDFARLPVVLYHQIAKVVEYLHIAGFCPISVLFATVVIKELIAHSQLGQQSLIAMGQFFISVVSDNVELVDNAQ